MRNLFAVSILASAAFAGGCTTAGTSPATTPPLPGPTTQPSSLPPPSTIPPPTTPSVGSTTIIDREAEIQAIFEDLERRRLQAIYDQDEEAFRAVYANDAYLERSLVLIDVIEFLGPPGDYPIRIITVLSDSVSCISVVIETNLSGITVGGRLATKTQTVELQQAGWGISYVGDDWSCAGPHPLS